MVDEQLIVLEYLKILLSMLRFLKIFPQKPKSFPNQLVSLNYVLFTSDRKTLRDCERIYTPEEQKLCEGLFKKF